MKYLLLLFIFLHAYQKSTDPHYFIWFPICFYPLLRLLELSSWLCSYHCQAQNSLCFLNAYRINSKLHISYEVLVTDLYPLIFTAQYITLLQRTWWSGPIPELLVITCWPLEFLTSVVLFLRSLHSEILPYPLLTKFHPPTIYHTLLKTPFILKAVSHRVLKALL